MKSMELDELTESVPIIPDSALVDFASSFSMLDDQIAYRMRRSFFKYFFDSMKGDEAKRQNLIDGQLFNNQQKLFQSVIRLINHQQTSDIILSKTQKKLLQTRETVRILAKKSSEQAQRLSMLEDRLEGAIEEVHQRVNALEREVERLTAIDILTERVEAWTAGRTYRGLPWFIQVYFLAIEVFHALGPKKLDRPRIVEEVALRFSDKVVSELNLRLSSSTTTVKRLVTEELTQMEQDQSDMVLAILDPRKIASATLQERGLEFVFGTALELTDAGQSPQGACDAALGLAKSMSISMQRVYDVPDLVDQVVREQLAVINQPIESVAA